MNSNNSPIGIFDSGVGGLTIAAAIRELLPQESFIYFGDTRHAPYGDKSKASIVDFSMRSTAFLRESGCKAIVIACNSASAMAYSALCQKHPHFPLYNVIEPVVRAVVQQQPRSVGVIATRATIRSQVYAKHFAALRPQLSVHSKATPLLAAIVEEGFAGTDISRGAIREYLSHSSLSEIDSLILGCTHYPLLQSEIEAYYQGRVNVVNSPQLVAQHLREALSAKQLLRSSPETAETEFYLSEKTKAFQDVARLFFGQSIKLLEKRL